MHFLALISAMAALPLVAIAAGPVNAATPTHDSDGAFATPDDFYHSCTQAECKFVAATDKPNVKDCTCNDNPDGWDDLIWFYEKPNYIGKHYKGFGDWGTCYNLPSIWYAKTGSAEPNTMPQVACCIYTQPNCGENGEHSQRDTNVAIFQGLYQNGVRSFRCSEKFNDQSTCFAPPAS